MNVGRPIEWIDIERPPVAVPAAEPDPEPAAQPDTSERERDPNGS